MREGGFNAENEMALARRIAVSAYTAFRYAMHNVGPRDQPMPAWDQLPEEAQDGWFRAVFVVRGETEDCVDLKWSALAKSAYDVYAKAVGASEVAFDTLEKKQQVAWEAATRHVMNLFDADDLTEDGLEDMEVRWTSWADKRLVTV